MVRVVEVEFKGLKEIQRNMRRLGQRGYEVGRTALRKSTVPIKEEAKRLAPVETGLLEETIRSGTLRQRNREVIAYQVTTGTRLKLKIPADASGYYPAVQEYGSKKLNIPDLRYMLNALERKRDQSISIIIRELKNGLIKR